MGKQPYTIEDKMRKDIDKTIDALEADIKKRAGNSKDSKKTGNSAKENTSESNGTHSHDRSTYYDSSYRSRQRLIWITVGFLGILILGLWGWHMHTVFYDVSRGAISGPNPFQNVGTYFDEAMKIATPEEEQANAESPTEITTSTAATEDEKEKQEETKPTEDDTLTHIISTLQAGLATTTTSTVTSTSTASSTVTTTTN